MYRDSGEERKGSGETVSGRRRQHHGRQTTHLRATLTVLPALVPQDGEATLLSSNTLLLLEGGTEGARSDLGVLVVPAESPVASARGQRMSQIARTALSCNSKVVEDYSRHVREDVAPGSTAHRGGRVFE